MRPVSTVRLAPRRLAPRVTAALALGALLAGGSAVAVSSSAFGAVPSDARNPDFGPNVTVFDPSTPVDQINSTLEAMSGENEFTTNRHAVLFRPGTYGSAAGQDDPLDATGIVNADVGYYTTIAGLGSSPDDVQINGALHVEPIQGSATEPWNNGDPGSLTRFWRSISNFAINPIQRPVGDDAARPLPEGVVEQSHAFRWAVSQAAPMRRIDVQGSLSLFGRYGEFASGGYIADTKVAGTVYSGSQQQYYTRDSSIGNWDGGVWNMVYSGVQGAPADSYPTAPFATPNATPNTTLASTPQSRQAPFLTIDSSGAYSVFAPDARSDAAGTGWSAGGRSIPITDFYIAKPGDSVGDINAALDSGKNLLITPGVYELGSAIQVTRPGTVVLGMGMATLSPTNGNAAIEVGDTTGVQLSGITVDAGATNSPVLVQVGPSGASDSSASDPTTLTDVFIRIGGPHAGSATTSIQVNSDHVLLDDIWAWRADHGAGVGWGTNPAATGVEVNGDDVTATGLFVEHFQRNQVLWNGNGGTTVFYQSELPYDVPSQGDWMDGGANGYASYRVGDDVTSHTASGLGVYSNFLNGGVVADNAYQAPSTSGVSFRHLMTRFLNNQGQISHVIDGQGDAVSAAQGQQTTWLGGYGG